MEKEPFGMPGIGGGFGQCALCGDSFVVECCLGKPVVPFTWEGCENTLYSHRKCLENIPNGQLDVTTLPEKSPLRRAYERQTKLITPTAI